jgi:hypothetical protein
MTAQLALDIHTEGIDRQEQARQLIEDAIRTTAVLHGGRVTQNAVRTRLTGLPRDLHHLVGQVYRSLRLSGHLSYDGLTEVSDDVAGGNAGKIHRTYVWVGDPR